MTCCRRTGNECLCQCQTVACISPVCLFLIMSSLCCFSASCAACAGLNLPWVETRPCRACRACRMCRVCRACRVLALAPALSRRGNNRQWTVPARCMDSKEQAFRFMFGWAFCQFCCNLSMVTFPTWQAKLNSLEAYEESNQILRDVLVLLDACSYKVRWKKTEEEKGAFSFWDSLLCIAVSELWGCRCHFLSWVWKCMHYKKLST